MKLRTLLMFSVAVLGLNVFASGCDEKSAAAQESKPAAINDQHCLLPEGPETMSGSCCPADTPAQPQDPAAQAAPEPEQTVCPVMGGAINKEIFTEYQGKKVYFCCGGCKPEFEKNPEKYISKLPQFKAAN